MDKINIMEKLHTNINNVYDLVIVASKRVRELNEGSQKLIETSSRKPVLIALEEIVAGKVKVKDKEPDVK